jgi:hypothetical protein
VVNRLLMCHKTNLRLAEWACSSSNFRYAQGKWEQDMIKGVTTMRARRFCQLLALALLIAPGSMAQSGPDPMQSDWLELVEGYRGDDLGVQVVEIEEGDSADMQKVTLAVPKKAVANPNEIEEVVVIGRMPEKSEPLDITYEWVADYDSDNYGLVIRLGKDTNWPIRLYMNSAPGFVR